MRCGLWTFLALCACSPAVEAGFTVSPEVGDLGPTVPLTRRLTVTTEVPTRISVAYEDARGARTLAFDALDTHHDVLLHGFAPGGTTTLVVTARDALGHPSVADPIAVEVAPLPDRFPIVEPLVLDAARMEPGYTLFDVKTMDETLTYLVAFDDAFEPVWLLDAGVSFGDVRQEPDGTLLALGGGHILRLDLAGHFTLDLGREPQFPEVWRFADVSADHEVFPLADGGFATFDSAPRAVDAYPSGYGQPPNLRAATISDPSVTFVGEGGAIQGAWSLGDRLDTSRIGYESLELTSTGYDWAHCNGVIATDDGGFLVSARHQDALVQLTADGDVAWILGDPGGWAPPLSALLLTPVGAPFAWPYHQHAPAIGPDGTIWVFDNHSWGATPYGGAPQDDVTSRVVGFRVDPVARTVEQVASFEETATGPLYSMALGDADPLPITGNVLADYGLMSGEGDVANADAGWGTRSVRLVEFDPTGEPALDVRLRGDAAVEPGGWKTYRAERIPSLYPLIGAGTAHWE